MSSPERGSVWPASSILFWGTFGTNSPEGKRYHHRCSLALVAMILGTLAFWLVPQEARFLARFVPGTAFAYIAWEFRRYVNSLDELARRIQMEAATWTYLTGMAAGTLLFGNRIDPLWIILLEPVRAGWLYVVAKRY